VTHPPYLLLRQSPARGGCQLGEQLTNLAPSLLQLRGRRQDALAGDPRGCGAALALRVCCPCHRCLSVAV
jgi:hypothetical protein